jgi:hemerythrin
MAFFEWNSIYSVNVREVDQQHRRLIDLINELHEAMTEDCEQHTFASAVNEVDALGSMLEGLMDYAAHHFTTEETLMRQHDYPGYEAHSKAHSDFVDRVNRYKRDFEEGRALPSTKLVQFAKDWLTGHIQAVDKRLGVFLNEKGIR